MQNRLPHAVYWFSFGDKEMLELVVSVIKELAITELRTGFSWADWERPEGEEWFDHFTSRLQAERITLMPCLFYTPMQRSRRDSRGEWRTSYPPEDLEDYARFTGEMIRRYGHTFEWLQLWNEANWDVYWNWEMDPDWRLLGEMLGYAIPEAKKAGKKVVLGGLSPYDAPWVEKMFEYGVMQEADALGIHAFPGTWDPEPYRLKGRSWQGLAAEVEAARAQLIRHGSKAEVWLTETGYSTFGEGEFKKDREKKQIDFWEELLTIPAERIYWHTIVDQRGDSPTDNELNSALGRDTKAYHFGVVDEAGNNKPLYYHWKNKAPR